MIKSFGDSNNYDEIKGVRAMRLSILLLLPAIQLAGCASIVNGQTQVLSVQTVAKGEAVEKADCTLLNNKGTWFVTTPGTVSVHRSYQDLHVTCKKEGLEPGIVTVTSSTKPMAFGNILFGGLIGVGVDTGTGAAYDYPQLLPVEMGQTSVLPVKTPTPESMPKDKASVVAPAADSQGHPDVPVVPPAQQPTGSPAVTPPPQP